MTKHWVMYILAAVGLTALVLWIYNRLNRKTPPYTREPIVSVSTDDPNMIVPDFGTSKPLWDPTWILDVNRELTTTYVKKD